MLLGRTKLVVLAATVAVAAQGLVFGVLRSRPKESANAAQLVQMTRDPGDRGATAAPEPRPPTTGAANAAPEPTPAVPPAAVAPAVRAPSPTLAAAAPRAQTDLALPLSAPPPSVGAPAPAVTAALVDVAAAPAPVPAVAPAPARPEPLTKAPEAAPPPAPSLAPPKPTPRTTAMGRPDAGRSLFAARCSSCHALSPRQYARAQWTSFFASGRHDRYQPLGDRVTAAEIAAIHGYLDENAADSERDQGAGLR
jgi:mono/diheme cytochrome c family protein